MPARRKEAKHACSTLEELGLLERTSSGAYAVWRTLDDALLVEQSLLATLTGYLCYWVPLNHWVASDPWRKAPPLPWSSWTWGYYNASESPHTRAIYAQKLVHDQGLTPTNSVVRVNRINASDLPKSVIVSILTGNSLLNALVKRPPAVWTWRPNEWHTTAGYAVPVFSGIATPTSGVLPQIDILILHGYHKSLDTEFKHVRRVPRNVCDGCPVRGCQTRNAVNAHCPWCTSTIFANLVSADNQLVALPTTVPMRALTHVCRYSPKVGAVPSRVRPQIAMYKASYEQ